MQGISRKITKNLICAANQESVSSFSAANSIAVLAVHGLALSLQRKNIEAPQSVEYRKTTMTTFRQLSAAYSHKSGMPIPISVRNSVDGNGVEFETEANPAAARQPTRYP